MKNTLIWVLIGLAAFFAFRTWSLNKDNIKLREKTAVLEENLQSKTVITQDKIVYIYRDKDNNAKQQEVYVPPMGDVEIKTPKETTTPDGLVVSKVKCSVFQKTIETENGLICITNKGFGIKPGILGIVSKEPEVGVGLSLAYWDRYVAGIGFTHRETALVYGGRHISDLVPFAPNTAAVISVGRNLKEQDTRVGVGILVHF